MGKFSAIFNKIFKSATPTDTIAKAVQKRRTPSLFVQDLAKVENANVQNALSEYLAGIANKTSRKATMQKAQVDDIIHKLDICDDMLIKTQAEELLAGVSGKSRKNAWYDISKAEHLLDSVNTAKGEYCALFSAKTPAGNTELFYKDFKKWAEEAKQKGNLKKFEKYQKRIEYGYSEPRKLFRINSRAEEYLSSQIMRNEEKYASLREYIEMYPNDKETATHLWKNYFVKSQNPKTQKILNEIYDKYGVRVCTNNETTIRDLIYLKEELEIYKKASNGEAKFPALFDIRKDYYIAANPDSAAYTNQISKIVIPNVSLEYASRHELAHMQEAFLKTNTVKVNKKDRQELLKAGIPEWHVDYFFKNEKESWAVFAEGDMSAYSNEFKQKMLSKNKKLPKWIVNLTPHYGYIANLKAAYPGVKNERMIDEINNILGYDALMRISQFNKQELEFAYKICKELPKDKKLSPQEFKTLLKRKVTQTKECRQNVIMEKRSKEIEDSFKEMRDAIEAQNKELEKAYEELSAELASIKSQYI